MYKMQIIQYNTINLMFSSFRKQNNQKQIKKTEPKKV